MKTKLSSLLIAVSICFAFTPVFAEQQQPPTPGDEQSEEAPTVVEPPAVSPAPSQQPVQSAAPQKSGALHKPAAPQKSGAPNSSIRVKSSPSPGASPAKKVAYDQKEDRKELATILANPTAEVGELTQAEVEEATQKAKDEMGANYNPSNPEQFSRCQARLRNLLAIKKITKQKAAVEKRNTALSTLSGDLQEAKGVATEFKSFIDKETAELDQALGLATPSPGTNANSDGSSVAQAKKP